MLVLTRKAGEEIVLPNRGVTIGVVAVKGKQVRLGITAPADVAVHRGEVWRRIRGSPAAGPDAREANGKSLRVLTDDQREAWQLEVRREIAVRTHGHVLGLEVEFFDGRLIVHGRSRSYYGKQLACAVALELMKAPDAEQFSQVELDIEVLGGP